MGGKTLGRRIFERLKTPYEERRRQREYDKKIREIWEEHAHELRREKPEDSISKITGLTFIADLLNKEKEERRLILAGENVQRIEFETPGVKRISDILSAERSTIDKMVENSNAIMHGAIMGAVAATLAAAGHQQAGMFLAGGAMTMEVDRFLRNLQLTHEIKKNAYKTGREIGKRIYEAFKDNPEVIQEVLKAAAAVHYKIPTPAMSQLARGIAHSILELTEG